MLVEVHQGRGDCAPAGIQLRRWACRVSVAGACGAAARRVEAGGSAAGPACAGCAFCAAVQEPAVIRRPHLPDPALIQDQVRENRLYRARADPADPGVADAAEAKGRLAVTRGVRVSKLEVAFGSVKEQAGRRPNAAEGRRPTRTAPGPRKKQRADRAHPFFRLSAGATWHNTGLSGTAALHVILFL